MMGSIVNLIIAVVSTLGISLTFQRINQSQMNHFSTEINKLIAEIRADVKESKKEMKDFHDRLCEIKARRKSNNKGE